MLKNKELKKIEQWGPLDATLLYVSWFYKTGKEMDSKVWGTKWCPFYCEHDKSRLIVYFDDAVMQAEGQAAIEKWIIVPDKKQELWLRYQQSLADLKDKWSKFSSLSEPERLTSIDKFIQSWEKEVTEFGEIVSVPEIANFATPKYLEQRLLGIVPESDMTRILEALLAPTQSSFHQKAELNFLQLIQNHYKTPEWEARLKEYLAKWHWVDNSYYQVTMINTEPWLERFRDLSKDKLQDQIDQIKKYPELVKARKEKIFKQYKLGRMLQDLAKDLAFSIWWQDDRKAEVWWYLSVVEKLSKYLGLKHQVDLGSLRHYFIYEWFELARFGQKVDEKTIKKRKNYFAAVVTPGYIKDYYGEAAHKFFSPLRSAHEKTLGQLDIISGTVACPANSAIQGKVRVVHSPKNAKFDTGEILVAPMTSPDFIHLMRQAKAIVTDVGGLMSHAAVVSRELNTPCIVGTKVATKKLNDGDEVEIDTDKGVVRIIK